MAEPGPLGIGTSVDSAALHTTSVATATPRARSGRHRRGRPRSAPPVYAARFRILPTSDSLAALSTLEELALAEDPVALIVADQRMPALSGTELLTSPTGRPTSSRR